MIKCKQAIEGTECGRTCCCLDCEQFDTCKIKCSDPKEACEYAFSEENALALMQTDAKEIISAISDLTVAKKQIEDREKEMRSKLVEAMERYDVKSFENEVVKFTYIAPTTRTTIDSAKLKKDLPDVAAKYSKTSAVSASVKITVK